MLQNVSSVCMLPGERVLAYKQPAGLLGGNTRLVLYWKGSQIGYFDLSGPRRCVYVCVCAGGQSVDPFLTFFCLKIIILLW